ncbi:flagellin N-terminal helical domain-containing protein [Pseudoduganella violacea]|uniref:Flagellin n=1 Tax=Pseudoduganella violacea TaxID=1715466 RepID=A0A7W5B730_9BURK|nr:flagellin [Pseudoduganella violacea]MBB3117733.1 flagellin [Pseudoduganella violacea]
MASVINSNIASLNSQRNLTGSQNALNTSLQRLSSGMRINSARDDAAGLAISDRMTSQIRGMTQAGRNANDGVSLAQTAEGALSSSGDILQRIRELAVQSSTSTNSGSDRAALQTEVTQMAAELNRIANTTAFNGQNLLDGTMGTAQFQVGADAGQLISATGANFQTNIYGNNQIANNTMTAFDGTNVANDTRTGNFTINGPRGSSAAITVAQGDSAKAIASKANAESGKTGVSASAITEVNLKLGPSESFTFDLIGDNTTAVKVSFAVGAGANEASDFAAALTAINAQTAKTGITAEFDASAATPSLKLTHSGGADIKVQNTALPATPNLVAAVQTYAADGVTLAGAAVNLLDNAAQGVGVGRVTFDSSSSFSVTEGTATTMNLGGTSNLNSVSQLDVSTFKGAQLAIKIADAALATVNTQRASFGALQARFASTISNLSATTENLSASRSRIQDTDFAAETASLTRGQILQQAGTAMLAQANSLPNGVLSLLRG